MTISVVCPQGHKLKAKDKLAGKSVKCPKCGAVVTIPSPDAPESDAGHASNIVLPGFIPIGYGVCNGQGTAARAVGDIALSLQGAPRCHDAIANELVDRAIFRFNKLCDHRKMIV